MGSIAATTDPADWSSGSVRVISPFSSTPIGFEGSTTTLPSRRSASFAVSSLLVSSQTAKTTASASAIASSTEAARASSPSSCASAAAFVSSFAARTTGSPPRTRCRASVPPMLPIPMTAVAMATPPFYLTPQLTRPYAPIFPLAKRAVDGDLVQSVLEHGELLLVEVRDEQFRDPAQVDRSGLGESRHAGVGQRDDDTACVRIGVGSPDEALLDQPGHTPGHARPGNERSVREVGHA